MRQTPNIHNGRLIDCPDEIIQKAGWIIECLERLKDSAHDGHPYEVEYYADCAKHAIRELCEIAEKECDYYERTSEVGGGSDER